MGLNILMTTQNNFLPGERIVMRVRDSYENIYIIYRKYTSRFERIEHFFNLWDLCFRSRRAHWKWVRDARAF